jgi:hypothetical protein
MSLPCMDEAVYNSLRIGAQKWLDIIEMNYFFFGCCWKVRDKGGVTRMICFAQPVICRELDMSLLVDDETHNVIT